MNMEKCLQLHTTLLSVGKHISILTAVNLETFPCV